MATNEETNAAGTDTRPPMLVENDYESWKIRIHRSPNDACMATMTQIAKLLSGLQKAVSPTNKPLSTSPTQGPPSCYTSRRTFARQCKEPNRKNDSHTSKDKSFTEGDKEKGDVLDAKLKLPR
ncbi:hypothetical protein Tco_0561395 [Tanacetum coccineum]